MPSTGKITPSEGFQTIYNKCMRQSKDMSRLVLVFVLAFCSQVAAQSRGGMFKKIRGYKAPELIAAVHREKAQEPVLQQSSLICFSISSCKSFDLEISTGICSFYNWTWLSSDSTYVPLDRAATSDHYEKWNGKYNYMLILTRHTTSQSEMHLIVLTCSVTFNF